jgi:hypothetical protein
LGCDDDAVERDEDRFDQSAHCGSPSQIADLVITGPASDEVPEQRPAGGYQPGDEARRRER